MSLLLITVCNGDFMEGEGGPESLFPQVPSSDFETLFARI